MALVSVPQTKPIATPVAGVRFEQEVAGSDGAPEIPLNKQHIGQGTVCLAISGPAFQRPFDFESRVFESTVDLQGNTQLAVDIRIVGGKPGAGGQRLDGLGRPRLAEV